MLSDFNQTLSKVKWKNPKAAKNEAYVPTDIEQFANIITHGLVLIPVFNQVQQMQIASDSEIEIWATRIYGAALTGLFTTSTVFHSISYFWQNSYIKEIFHRGDRAMIYLFIAGSYTPWLFLKKFPEDAYTQNLKSLIWLLALLGILYQQLYHERYKWLETTFYIIMGLAPAAAVFEMEDTNGLTELRYGGAAYLIGVIFFKSDGVIPFAHAIWHIHVVIGAMFHLHAVSTHLID